MESRDSPGDAAKAADTTHSLGTWTRIYLHGFLVLAVLFAAAYILTRLVPVFGFVGNPTLAVLLALLTIVVAPPLIGSFVLYGVFPILGKKKDWRRLTFWDDRLVREVASAKRRAQIVLINWPSKEVRTMGVLTAVYRWDPNGRQMAAVYVPTAPQTKLGYIRVVAMDDVEFTDWDLREWQIYQLTFGAAGPDRLQVDE